MFKNIGKKIKTLAKIIFWLIMLIGISLAISLFAMASSAQSWEGDAKTFYIIFGVLSILISLIIAIFSSYFMYGFGELIDKTCEIERNTRKTGSAQEQRRNTQIPSKQPKPVKTVQVKGQQSDNSEYFDITCPTCNNKLSFQKETSDAVCPYCDTNLKFKQ